MYILYTTLHVNRNALAVQKRTHYDVILLMPSQDILRNITKENWDYLGKLTCDIRSLTLSKQMCTKFLLNINFKADSSATKKLSVQ